MQRRRPRSTELPPHWWTVCVCLCVMLPAAPAGAEDCAVASLRDLLRILGKPMRGADATQLGFRGTPPHSLLDIQAAAATHAVELQGLECSLEAVRGLRSPVILVLRAPEHFVVALNQEGSVTHLLDGGALRMVAWEGLRDRYAGYAMCPVGPPGARPLLSIRQAHVDVGAVSANQDIVRQFVVTNAGDADLHLALAPRGCCGPSAVVDREGLPPGESAHVIVKANSGGGGRFVAAIEIRTDDPVRRIAYVTVAGDVPIAVTVLPKRLDMLASRGNPSVRRIFVSAPEHTRLLRVSVDDPAISAHCIGDQERGQRRVWAILVTAASATPPGGRLATLRVETSNTRSPLVEVPIRVGVRSDLIVTAAVAFFGFMQFGQREERVLIVRSESGTPFTIKEAKLDAPGVRVSDPVQVTPSEWELGVTLNAERPGIIDTKLVLTTDVPGEETLEIPVYAHVLAAE